MKDKVYLSAAELQMASWQLAARIRLSGWRPDVLLALWRGGAPVGVTVHEFFKATGWPVRHLPVKCSSYTGIRQNAGEVVFDCAEEVFASLRPQERVLVVDDVFDTGKSAAAVRARLRACGVDFRLACPYWKPSPSCLELGPDWFVHRLEEWIVFPHELEGLTAEELKEKNETLAALVRTVREQEEV